ncbi:MAG: DUF5106 domain-containing protein [Bacteroidales bacterium]|nr:DUF5106 domain-containing protein [Bacteroidales bacterium]
MYICLLIAFAALVGCGGNGGENKASAAVERQFPSAPEVPSVYTDPYEAAKFVAEHYWDNFLEGSEAYPTDSVRTAGVRNEAVSEAMGSYILFVCGKLVFDDAKAAFSSFYDSLEATEARDTSSGVFEKMSGLLRFYLYDVNSPYRNEDLYLPFVEKLSKSQFVPRDERTALEFDVQMCSLNKAGTKASDFSFITREGRRGTLGGIKASYTVLFFSNPGCHACKEIVDAIGADAKIQKMLQDGSLAVVNIYIDDDIQAWKEYSASYPQSWICGYDNNHIIRDDLIYNVRAIPSVYLLAADKTVIMKDAPYRNLIAYLNKLQH